MLGSGAGVGTIGKLTREAMQAAATITAALRFSVGTMLGPGRATTLDLGTHFSVHFSRPSVATRRSISNVELARKKAVVYRRSGSKKMGSDSSGLRPNTP